jgi:hypothetical protein
MINEPKNLPKEFLLLFDFVNVLQFSNKTSARISNHKSFPDPSIK